MLYTKATERDKCNEVECFTPGLPNVINVVKRNAFHLGYQHDTCSEMECFTSGLPNVINVVKRNALHLGYRT